MQMNRQPIRGTIKKQRQVSTKQKYLQAEQRYLNGEFTYDTHCLIQNLTEKGRLEPHMQGVQLYQSFIQIAKILMLNELEILFLGATLQEMKWKIIDNCITPYIDDFKGLSDKIKSDTYNKKIQLSLLMIGHVVKLYLNDTDQISMFEYRIKDLMYKDYDKMYQEWVERMKKNFKFSPKNMNKLFREMDVIRTKKQSELDDVNYNSKVEELFKIFVQPDTKNQHREHHHIMEDYEVEEEELPLPVNINNMARTESIKSLRSFGRRDSERSERDYGFGLRNIPSIFRNNSNLDDQ